MMVLLLASCGAVSWELFPTGTGLYQYAPAAVEEGAVHDLWWCRNVEPYQVVDHIYHRRFDLGAGQWSEARPVLAPGPAGAWDSVHVCDPSVIRGSFRLGEVTFTWLMAYLGCDRLDCRHNQVGLAVATDPGGPWTRLAGNPIITGSAASWGTGQPSLVSLDRSGRVLLAYTRQLDDMSTHLELAELDLADLAHPIIGEPRRLPIAGLTEPDGRQPVLHDADIALDTAGGTIFVARPQLAGPLNPPNAPVRLPSAVQLARADLAALLAGGAWTPLAEIGPAHTGFAFAHSPSFGRDAHGRLPDPSRLRVNLAVGSRTVETLWTYTLHGMVVEVR